MGWLQYLKQNDIPNWIAVAFSLIIWPIALALWNKRTFSAIRNLQILIEQARGWIPTGEECPYLILRFQNNTGERIYITDVSIITSHRIGVHPNADRNISTGGYTLKFAETNGDPFARYHVTVETQHEVATGLPLANNYDNQALNALIIELRDYRRNGIIARYFILEFDCMVGRNHRKVRFKF